MKGNISKVVGKMIGIVNLLILISYIHPLTFTNNAYALKNLKMRIYEQCLKTAISKSRFLIN